MSRLKSLVRGRWKMKYKYPVVVSWPKNQLHTFQVIIWRINFQAISRRPMLIPSIKFWFCPPAFFSVPTATHHNKGKMNYSDNQKVLSDTPACNESLSESSLSLCLSLSLLYILWAQIRQRFQTLVLSYPAPEQEVRHSSLPIRMCKVLNHQSDAFSLLYTHDRELSRSPLLPPGVFVAPTGFGSHTWNSPGFPKYTPSDQAIRMEKHLGAHLVWPRHPLLPHSQPYQTSNFSFTLSGLEGTAQRKQCPVRPFFVVRKLLFELISSLFTGSPSNMPNSAPQVDL